MAMLLLLLILPLLAQANNEDCRVTPNPGLVTAIVGSTALISFNITSSSGCQIVSASWSKTRHTEWLASYDNANSIWDLSHDASVRYQGRLELSRELGQVAWLRLLRLRMEDDGIYDIPARMVRDSGRLVPVTNFLIVQNPCPCLVTTPHEEGVRGKPFTFHIDMSQSPDKCIFHNFTVHAGNPTKQILLWHGPGKEAVRSDRWLEIRVEVRVESERLLSVTIQNLSRIDSSLYEFRSAWGYGDISVDNSTFTRLTVVDEAVSKPHVESTPPSVREGDPLVLRCILPQGSPPITYTWLLKNQSSELTETVVSVEVETWTVHDARDGDMVACDVSNTVNGERKNITSDFLRLNVTQTPESNFPGIPHYIIWSPVLIILMLAGTTCLCVYHRMRGKRQRPSENMYDNVGTCAEEPNAMEMSRLRQTDDAETSPVSHPQRAGQGSVSLPESEYEDLRRVECVYDRLGLSPALPPNGTPSAPPRRCRGDRAKTSKHVNLN